MQAFLCKVLAMKMMDAFRWTFRRTRSVLLVGLLAGMLGACGGRGGMETSATSNHVAAEQTQQQTGAMQDVSQEQLDATASAVPQEGMPVAILLADTEKQEGWVVVPMQSGVLYVSPQPVITRSDLTDVQAGRGRSGEGLLALGLSQQAQIRLRNTTTQFPNKRLALVIGQNMVAAPGYTAPVSSDRLVFPLGTTQNAAAAAFAITGQEQ